LQLNSIRVFVAIAALLALGALETRSQGPAVESGAAPLTNKVAATASSKKSSAATRAQGGQQEGIKIHGHWVIEIRNPDGSVAARREFENALNLQGSKVLAVLLTQLASGGRWAIVILGSSTTGPCPNGILAGIVMSGGPCVITQGSTLNPTSPPYSVAGPGLSLDLTAAVAGANQDQVVLSGSVKALATSDISVVGTLQGVCAGNATPVSCARVPIPTALTDFFSGTRLVSPVSVQQGQTIDVTVTFSFS